MSAQNGAAQDARSRITKDAEFRVAVVGLGKIGLGLAAQFAARQCRVIGCDVNADVVRNVSSGRVPAEVEPSIGGLVAAAVRAGWLVATTDTQAAVRESNVVVVIVPLIVNQAGKPDFTNLDAATRSIAAGLQRDTLVLSETTLPVGTTRYRIAPVLDTSGLSALDGFDLAFSPERVLVGRLLEDLQRHPK